MTTRLILYIAGDGPRSARAAEGLRGLCEAADLAADQLEIVDVLDRPDLAEQAGIVATPTAVAITPHATRRVIGDLTDLQRLASALDVDLRHDRL